MKNHLPSPKSGFNKLPAMAVAAVALVSLPIQAQAGGFGGPPPFTNDSPLTTGVDGSYQASARASNLTGIIRFQYSSGNQTSTTARNRYIFFINGDTFIGPVTADISGSSLSGVLEGPNTTTAFADARMNGEFNGKFKTMSGNYSFKGEGMAVFWLATNPPTNTLFAVLSRNSFKFTGVRNSQTST